MGAAVAHHAHRLDRQEHGKSLRRLGTFQLGTGQLGPHDGVRSAQGDKALRCDAAKAADSQARARKGLPPHKRIRQPDGTAHLAHLILEQIAQRFHQFKI